MLNFVSIVYKIYHKKQGFENFVATTSLVDGLIRVYSAKKVYKPHNLSLQNAIDKYSEYKKQCII